MNISVSGSEGGSEGGRTKKHNLCTYLPSRNAFDRGRTSVWPLQPARADGQRAEGLADVRQELFGLGKTQRHTRSAGVPHVAPTLIFSNQQESNRIPTKRKRAGNGERSGHLPHKTKKGAKLNRSFWLVWAVAPKYTLRIAYHNHKNTRH